MESSEREEIKRHFDVIAENLRDDIKGIAEGHGMLNRKLDTVQEDPNSLRKENAGEHKELLSETKSSYTELNYRVSTLEKR